jgi:hypothetical protein
MPTARLVSITPNYKELLCTACGNPEETNLSCDSCMYAKACERKRCIDIEDKRQHHLT